MPSRRKQKQGRTREDRIVAVYVRMEDAEDEQEQLQMCRSKAQILGLNNLVFYTDKGELTKDAESSYSRLLNDIELKKVDIVLSADVQVISRNIQDFLSFAKQLEDKNIKLICCYEGVNTDDPYGTFMFHVITLVIPEALAVSGMREWFTGQ